MEAARKGRNAARRRKPKKERSTGHKTGECPVCMAVFDDTVQRPRTLPCGHTVCMMCVNKLKQQGHVACPECLFSHPVPEGGQLPVSYIVRILISGIRVAMAAAADLPQSIAGTEQEAAGAAGQKEVACLSTKMRSFLQKQEASAVAAITACQEVQAQLDQYQTTLTGWGEQQQQLEDRLQDLLGQSRSARELVRQEESRAAAKKEEAREGERQLHVALEALRTPAAEQEARVAVAEVLRRSFKAKEVLHECRGSFPDSNTANTVRKVTGASIAALEAFQASMESFQAVQADLEAPPSVAEADPRPQSEECCTIMDRLQAILTPSLKSRMVSCNSQQRGREAGGSVPREGEHSLQSKIVIIPSTTREPKLKTTENAWKPSAKENANDTDDAQIVKAMRGILNKITPHNFGKLVDTVKTMPINTMERLSAVTDLIYENAVNEQIFSSTYAQMCHALSLVSGGGNDNECNSWKQQEKKLRNLIVCKCQKEFEKDNTKDFRERLQEIEACLDPDKKLELVAKMKYDEINLRKRSVGNIRFIGELYKLRMLTSPIMMRIIGTLLDRGDEMSLECLCKLLTTVGKILETQCTTNQKAMTELEKYFKKMDKIVHERQTATRMKFLLMDVIDLRQNLWVPI